MDINIDTKNESTNTQLNVGFDNKTLSNLDKLVDFYGKTRTEIIKLSINRLYSDIEND